MICNIPVGDDKTPTSSKFPKNPFSYIKSQKSESSNIAIALTSESEYLSFISFSNFPKSLFIFSQFALEYLNIFLGFGWHLLKEVIQWQV
jgi:hypothetical protein